MATVDVLFNGYADDRVAGTVSLVRDADFIAIVDPGMVPNRSVILKPLADLGVAPDQVTDVILSHHHPDHTVNIALFENAKVHDHWAIYEADIWTDRPAEGAQLAPGVRLLETPGHTAQDITTVVDTDDGVVALTHLWWDEASDSDPLAQDLDALFVHRKRVLDVATLIVPGHGAPFRPAGG
ncbi:MAG TPA: MBL fold metallo-hydrolase [Actinomycetes bacterium]|nr:MBL fold metallo-hydrolase [Actinomycetes bacterium]